MRLITKINNRISIYTYGRYHYAVAVKKNPKQNIKHADMWYPPNLESCFIDVFEILCSERLGNGNDKSFTEIARIILTTKKEIEKIMEPLRLHAPNLKVGKTRKRAV